MVSEVDEGKGLVKVYWKDIRKRVAKVEPAFAKIVDELDPGKDFPLYLAYFPYGALKGDTQSPFIPNPDGSFYRLSDPNAPKDVIKNLGYGMYDSPLGMVLEKNFEYFADISIDGISIPKIIYTPGSFLSFKRNLTKRGAEKLTSNHIFSMSAGARSIFMLPNIECATNHAYLQRDYNINASAPKSLYAHWQVFKEIASSPISKCDWTACLVYFSESWINALFDNKAWIPLKAYLYENAWEFFKHDLVAYQYDFIFSVIQKIKKLKPDPYLADTAKHLFMTALSSLPGYNPLTNDELCPLETLQLAYVNSYGLKRYIPTIMGPAMFNINSNNPIYYSLNYPSTYVFSPRARKIQNTLLNLREISRLIKEFASVLKTEQGMCADAQLGVVAKEVDFGFFHNEEDLHRVIEPSVNIGLLDQRFDYTSSGVPKVVGAKFASDARFVRGCIKMKSKEDLR